MRGFSSIVVPMTKLLQKDKKIKWDDTYETRFMELKIRLTTMLVIALPFRTKGFIIYSDAFSKELDCELMQYENVVAYASDSLDLMRRIT